MSMSQSVESQAVVQKLKGQVRGPVLQPGEPEFDEARSVWNAMIDRHPAVIVRCLGVPDVVACVNAARTHGVPLTVKGGGHNIAGLAVCDGGLMMDMSLMRGVQVDPARRVARAEPGCLLGDVDRETESHGLAAVLGFVSATGCAGLTLGGGFGYLTRRFGWSSDNLAAVDSSPPTAAWSAPRNRKTPICSGACAAVAAISASPRDSNTSCSRWARTSSPGRLPGAARRRPASSISIDPS